MIGLYGGLLGLGAVPGPEKCDFTVSFAPMGSSEAAALLNTPLGRNVVRALEQGYTVCPMGSESASELRNRIAVTFLQSFGRNLSSGTSVSSLLSNPCLHNAVVSVSAPSGPTGTRCPGGSISSSGTSTASTGSSSKKIVEVSSDKIDWNALPGLVTALASTGLMVTAQVLAAKKSRREKLPVPQDFAEQQGWVTPARVVLIVGGVLVAGAALYYAFGRKKKSVPSAIASVPPVLAPKPITVKARKR